MDYGDAYIYMYICIYGSRDCVETTNDAGLVTMKTTNSLGLFPESSGQRSHSVS